MTENKTDATSLFNERVKLFHDFYNNIIPKRAPANASLSQQMIAEYFGISPKECQYDSALVVPALEKVCERLFSDSFITTPPVLIGRPAAPYQLMNSQSFVLGERGFTQHPEVVGMLDTEYDGLINRGFDFLVETVVPRQHKNLDISDPVKMAYTIQLVQNYMNNGMTAFLPVMMQLSQKHGYYPGAPMGSGGFSEAPFDFLADQLRSFSGISADVRRDRSKVKAAVDVLTPLMYHWGLPAFAHPEGSVGFPLHMPTFMREKDFVELWLPSFKAIIEQYAARGIRSSIFLEDDWTRYLDIVESEFPAGTCLQIEKGDPKQFKDKLGKKFILANMFPVKYAKEFKKEAMLDEAKKFLDIMLPGGGYSFGVDKLPLMACDISLDNYCALMDFVHEYAVYENAGQSYGVPLNSEGFAIDKSFDNPIKSQYVFNWDKFKASYPMAPDFAQAKFAIADKQVFTWYMNLLV